MIIPENTLQCLVWQLNKQICTPFDHRFAYSVEYLIMFDFFCHKEISLWGTENNLS